MRTVVRRLTIPLLVALLLVSGLTTVATAAVSGDARLTGGTDVLPGQARPFEVEVSNTAPMSVMGGEPINWVSIRLPATAGVTTNSDVTPPSGWSAKVTNWGSLQVVRFRTGTEPIAPGASLRFAFPADVAAPASGDRSGDFRVAVSSDDGQNTTTATGALTTTIRVLEVTSMGAVAPADVTDQTASAGQAISYGVSVRNHALDALTVTPSLISSQGDDVIGDVASAAIASGATHDFAVPVTLGGVASGERTSTFVGDASSAGAAAVQVSAALRVQAPPALTLDADTFSPGIVRSGTPLTYDFSVTAAKTGIPELTLDDCALSFAGTTGVLAAPVTFGANDVSRTLSFPATSVSGAEGSHPVTVSCQGVDGNGNAVNYELSLPDAVTIDNTAPGVQVQLDIPAGQDAVKNGDSLTIAGALSETATLDFVRLRTNLGQVLPCDQPTRDGAAFTCTLTPTFDPGTTDVLAEAQATDTAGNVGGAASDVVTVDLLAPELVLARTESATRVLVHFDEDHDIRGGCNPAQWSVNGHVVSQVLFSDDTDCTSPPGGMGQQGPSDFRVLVLADELDNRDETPVVRYERSSLPLADNVLDGAGHLAATAEVTAVPGILPPAPEIADVTRTDSAGSDEREPATVDGDGTKPDTGTYWTNQSGDDLQVSFAGARTGYQVQVVDGAGEPVAAPQDVTSEAGDGTIAVPIGTTDGRQVRGVRLINAAGAGDATFFDVVLDRTAPAIASATASGNDVTVTFSEILAFGTDFASDWYAWEDVHNGRDYYQAQQVDTTDRRDQRLLTVQLEGNGAFGGVDYLFDNASEARRYEDRAGNLLADTLP